jgi:hypothetical protein
VTKITYSLNGAVNKLNREKGRRQNGVSNTDRFKNSQGHLTSLLENSPKASICLSAATACDFRKKMKARPTAAPY